MKDSNPNSSIQSKTLIWHIDLRGTMATNIAIRIDHHKVRQRPNILGKFQTKNTNPMKNKKMHTPSQPKDNGGVVIPEPHFLNHPRKPRPRRTSSPPIRAHTTSHTTDTHTTLYKPDGTTICSIENRRLDKLHDICKHESTNPPFKESLAKLIKRHNKQHDLKKIQRELQLTKSKTASET